MQVDDEDAGVHSGASLPTPIAGSPTGSVPDPDYDAMDAGEISEKAYLDRVLERLGDEDIDYDPKRDPDWDDEERESVWALIADIAAEAWRGGLAILDTPVKALRPGVEYSERHVVRSIHRPAALLSEGGAGDVGLAQVLDLVSGLVDLAESGALELSDLGLDAEALGEAAVRIGDEAWHDPESAAVRAAYVALAANREAVLEAVRGNAPAPRP